MNGYGNLYEPIDKKIELGVKIQEREQGEGGFSFASRKKIVLKFFKYHDLGASIFCYFPIP